METRRSVRVKNFLAITALLLALAALQCPLWRGGSPPSRLTARSGRTILVPYEGDIQRALIFQKRNATLSGAGRGQLAIHAHQPGKTRMLIQFKDGVSRVYELLVLPG
jgi:hypothetical protein